MLAVIVGSTVTAVVGISIVFRGEWLIILTPGAVAVGALLAVMAAFNRPTWLSMIGVFTGVILSYVLFDPIAELLAVTLRIGAFALFVALPLAPLLSFGIGSGLVLTSRELSRDG